MVEIFVLLFYIEEHHNYELNSTTHHYPELYKYLSELFIHARKFAQTKITCYTVFINCNYRWFGYLPVTTNNNRI